MTESTIWAIFLSIVALVVSLVVKAKRKGKKWQALKKSVLESRGFAPLSELPQNIVQTIEAVYRNELSRFGGYRFGQNLFSLNAPNHRLIMGDVTLISKGGVGHERTYLKQTVLIVNSDKLALPAFSAFPKPQTGKVLMATMNLLEKAPTWIPQHHVSFPDLPDFDKRYLISSFSEKEMKNLITKEVANCLSSIEYLNLDGFGSTIIMFLYDAQWNFVNQPGIENKLHQLIDTGEKLAGLLKQKINNLEVNI